jgi:tripartite-type tricarboxylate transporter receptor subunit TctC
VNKLSEEVAQSAKDPSVIESLAKQGVIAANMNRQQFADYVKAEVERWGKVVKESGAKID